MGRPLRFIIRQLVTRVMEWLVLQTMRKQVGPLNRRPSVYIIRQLVTRDKGLACPIRQQTEYAHRQLVHKVDRNSIVLNGEFLNCR